ncbi:alpha-N-acetylglucosaminidase C-terminal domain-containing protein [Pendulispora rubella]|uniref:Alpha-N-acetylglucosaminidase C-terminal domain-containing protein n=1 Tax=Pendulispora rubella TaxID=2741070 RepID=A0ABZ2LGN8_9BACT
MDTAAWFARWAHLRYGGADPHAAAAWEALRTSAFAMSGEDRWSEPHDGLSRTLLPKIDAAFRAKDAAAFAKLTETWLRLMDRLEAVTRTDRRFLLGPIVAHASRAAVGRAEREQLEYDLRSLYTVWGTRTASEAGLHDYANRELSGLIEGLYRPRWQRYFEELSSALAENRAPRAMDWYAMEESWARTHEELPTAPSGSPFEAAQAALDALTQE